MIFLFILYSLFFFTIFYFFLFRLNSKGIDPFSSINLKTLENSIIENNKIDFDVNQTKLNETNFENNTANSTVDENLKKIIEENILIENSFNRDIVIIKSPEEV